MRIIYISSSTRCCARIVSHYYINFAVRAGAVHARVLNL
eukprot:SAG31_NODE_7165_length_1769_cov_1.417365_1_plen_38_part_10